MAEDVERSDIQGIVARGYGHLKAASFHLLTVTDPAATRRWLGSVAPLITTSDAEPTEFSLNLAFTHGGLRHLGLSDAVLAQFPVEYSEGMTTSHRRRVLGDIGQNAPEEWRWGGPSNPPVHILVLLYGADQAALSRAHERCLGPDHRLGMEEVGTLATILLTDKEHFGFHDGISQPVIDGLHRPGPWANTIRPGEIVLGYQNEYGQYPRRLWVDPASDPDGVLQGSRSGSDGADFGLNGSYLVFRQLSQDVRGFWRYLEEVTRNADGTANPHAQTRLGAKWVGRWPSGAPLVTCPEVDDPSMADFNDFGYHETDPAGLRCPIGSHVRRSHPRDSLDPDPGSRKSIA
ncbi:MAG: peroxidase [Actinomycetota bacterium]|nr:peroxidase [Actinomycetota bacterium]